MQDEREKEYVFVLTEKLGDSSACHVSQELAASPTAVTSVTTSSSDECATFGDSDDGGEQEEEEGEGEEEEDSVELDQMPVAMPFLPALDASTQITIHDGYSDAIMDAQHALDSRLLAYSQYQQMARPKQVLLTPRRPKAERFVMTARPAVVDRPVTVCMGWQRVSNIDSSSRDLLRVLEEDGVSYEPHDTAYSVKYLAPVLPFGDCLFLSMEQLLLYTEECEPLSPEGIRRVATKFFLAHYTASAPEEQQKIDKAIQNLYFPTLKGGWGVSPVQTRRFVARRSDKKMLLDKCAELQKRGYSWGKAAEAVYMEYAQPIVDAHSYCDYMTVGRGENTHFLISLNYSSLESSKMNENLEKKIIEISRDNTTQNKEIECLKEANMNLVGELNKLHEELEEQRVREDCLSLELQEKDYEFGLWEAEAETVYFDFQISSIREVLLETKMDELTKFCGRVGGENASKSLEIEPVKGKNNKMEREMGELKLQLHAYAPAIASLRDDVVSLEHNVLLHTRLEQAGSQESKCVDVVVHPDGSSDGKLIEDQHVMTKDILDLRELRIRIKAVEKVVEERNKPILEVSSYNRCGRDSAGSEIEALKSRRSSDLEKHEHAERRSPRNEHGDGHNRQKMKPKSFDGRNRTQMKDIPLDHVSDDSPQRARRRCSSEAQRAVDQMLELWETTEGCSPKQSVKDLKKPANYPTEGTIGYNQFRDLDWRSYYPTAQAEIEKELGVDKLELSMNSSDSSHETTKQIQERLASDAEKLMSLQMNVDNMRRKLYTNRKARKAKNVDFEAAKEQLQQIELMAVQLVNLNAHLLKNAEESTLLAGSTSAESKEVMNIKRNRVSEQARKGSEKVERLQLEVQKLQYMLLKLDDEKNGIARSRFSRSNAGIVLKNFIHIGKRNSEKRKKVHLCGCFAPSNSSSNRYYI